jgi:hypothetical protein
VRRVRIRPECTDAPGCVDELALQIGQVDSIRIGEPITLGLGLPALPLLI